MKGLAEGSNQFYLPWTQQWGEAERGSPFPEGMRLVRKFQAKALSREYRKCEAILVSEAAKKSEMSRAESMI